MTPESIIGDVEAALVSLFRYGLGWRYTVADLTALGALQPTVLADKALAFVTGNGLFEWSATSTATANGSTIAAAASSPLRGRWLKLTTSWQYGAGGTNLAAVPTGYLRQCEAYSADDGPDAAIDRVMAGCPSVLVSFQGDDPESASLLPGTLYRDKLDFQILIVSSNLRGKASATQGSPISGESVGAYRIIGDLRRLLCSNTEGLIEGATRTEIGAARLEFEDLDRRLFVHSMSVRVTASFSIDDEDLIDAAIRAIPKWVGTDEAPFDKLNYVADGLTLDEAPGAGTGLSRNVVSGSAVVGGVAVSPVLVAATFDPSTDTYRDLDSNGTWHFSIVAATSEAPSLAAGRLRVAYTRTDASDVVADRQLCSFAVPIGDPIDIA